MATEGLIQAVRRLLGGMAFAHAFAAACVFAVAAALPPDGFGAYVLFLSLLWAAPHLHFGLQVAMEKEVPLVAARGETDWGRALVEASWAGVQGIAALVGVALLLGALLTEGGMRAALLAGAAAVPCRQLMELRVALARVVEDSRRATWLITLATVAPMSGGLAGALLGGAEAACGLAAAGMVIATLATPGTPEQRVRPRWSAAPGRRLLALGGPLYLTIALDITMRVADRGIVVVLLGEAALGQYGVASAAGWTPWLIANAAGFFLLPRLLRDLGTGLGPERWVVKPGLWIGLAVLLPCLALALAGPPLIRHLLPGYEVGAEALLAVLPGVVARSLLLMPRYLLISLDDLRPLVLLAALALGLNLAGDAWVIGQGHGVVGVAWVTTGAFLLYGASVTVYALGRHLPRSLALYSLGGAAAAGLSLAASLLL